MPITTTSVTKTKKISSNRSKSEGVKKRSTKKTLDIIVKPVNQVLPEPETVSIQLVGCFKSIQLNAYYKWINAGRPEGRSIEFWLAAEREIVSMKCTKR